MKIIFSKYFKKVISSILIASFLFLTIQLLDVDKMLKDIQIVASRPGTLLFIFAVYLSAFLARGTAWKLYLQNKARLRTCMYGLFYSLLLNHLLPVKAGDLARIGILKSREQAISPQEAINSVIVLRMLDTAILFLMAVAGLAFLDLPINGMIFVLLGAGAAVMVIFFYFRFRAFFERHLRIMRSAFLGWRGLIIILLTSLSWVLEGGVIYGVLKNGANDFNFVKAVWVNSITVAGQIFQITPGGIASYEAIMVFALGASGVAGEKAYSAAIITHGLKYIFTFITGGIALAANPVPMQLLKKWTKERSSE